MKRCASCKLLLNKNNFNWKFKNVKLSSYCRECSRKYIRQHYLENRDYYLNKSIRRKKLVREQAYEYISTYLFEHPCVDCGEFDILVLEFDHKDRTSKVSEVSRIINSTGSISRLIVEISKCDVRCANCHRRKTAIENKSWKLRYV